MTNELENTANEVLVQILQGAVDATNAAVEFSKAHLPEVVEQLLMWHMIESLVPFLGGVVIVLLNLAFWWKVLPRVFQEFRKPSTSRNEFFEFVLPIIGGISSLGLVGSGLVAMFNNLNWLKILVAPKLYLLEYTASLIK